MDTSLSGIVDAFVTKLDAAGSALDYSTYLGGSLQEISYAIAVDGTGAAFVTGQSDSTDFPATVGAFDMSSNGNADVFVTKVNAAGLALN